MLAELALKLSAPSGDDLLRFAPEIILTIAGTVLMVLDPLFAKKYPKLFGHRSIFALARRRGRNRWSLYTCRVPHSQIC